MHLDLKTAQWTSGGWVCVSTFTAALKNLEASLPKLQSLHLNLRMYTRDHGKTITTSTSHH